MEGWENMINKAGEVRKKNKGGGARQGRRPRRGGRGRRMSSRSAGMKSSQVCLLFVARCDPRDSLSEEEEEEEETLKHG